MDDNSDSDVSSSYGSDREIHTSFAKEYSSSSDDNSNSHSGFQPILLVSHISEDEKIQILHVISSESVRSVPQIFPCSIKDKLILKYPHVVSRLNELAEGFSSVMVASRRPLCRTQDETRVKPPPRDVLLDICVFSTTQPVLVLTIASGDEENEKIIEYNSQLTRVLLHTVRQNTKYDIRAVHGVIEEDLCKTSGKFQEKINRLFRNARAASVASTLDMAKNKCVDIIQPILQLLSADGSGHPPQGGAVDGNPPVISEANFNAMLKRIEQLEIDSKRKEEKYDRLTDQMEKLKQDYLTDTRLTLLMRTRSSSVSESTVSGYGSSEVDLDIPHRLEHGAISRETGQTAQRGKAQSTTQPELTTAAKQHGHLELVQYNRDVTLHHACGEGKLEAVKYILSQGVANINCRWKFGKTPVMEAALKGQVSVFDFLVSQGCDLSLVDDNNNNVLHCACMGGNVDIVRSLLDSGKCDIESRDYGDMTPVMWAALYGQREVFDLLVKKHCDMKVVSKNKYNILHVASIGGCVDIVQYILSHNIVSIDSAGFAGRTPVMIAAEYGHKRVFECLVDRKCVLNLVDDQKNNILHLVCYGGCVDIVQYILSHNIVSIDSRGFVGRTPVMTATMNGHKHVFECLVDTKCDVYLVDDEKSNILHLACYFGQVDIVKHILTHNMVCIESTGLHGVTPVMYAVARGHIEIFNLLNSKKCNLVAEDDKKYNILHLACGGGHVDMVKHLMTLKDVKGMEKMKNKTGETPVQVAERKGHVAVVSLFKGRK